MLQLQRLAHHAHRILVQPVQVGLLLQEPWRRTRLQGLCQVSTFYTTLVKKSQEGNGASELRRTPLPRTRVNWASLALKSRSLKKGGEQIVPANEALIYPCVPEAYPSHHDRHGGPQNGSSSL
jgi:hypothetical protein